MQDLTVIKVVPTGVLLSNLDMRVIEFQKTEMAFR